MALASKNGIWAIRLSVTVLVALAACGVYLRFQGLNASLYDDEIMTRERALQSITYTLETRNYPLYYLAAKAALRLGDTEAMLRLPSFIAGILSILAIYGLVHHLHSRTAGLVAAGLMAFNPFHITHSDFARYYAVLVLFTILTVWSLIRVLERGRWRHGVAYTLCAFFGLSSHVCFAPALIMLSFGGAIYLLCQPQRGTLKRRLGLVALLVSCTFLSFGNFIFRDLRPAKVFQPADTIAANQEQTGVGIAAKNKENGHAEKSTWWSSAPAAHQQHPLGGGATFSDPDTGNVRYILTYYDCLEYLKRFFWTNTPWIWPLLIVAGVCGIFDLLYRIPAAGIPLSFAFFLSPVPLFFVSTDHWYHPRYFSYAYVFALILVSIGLCVPLHFLARVVGRPSSVRLWRRTLKSQSAPEIPAVNLAFVLLVLCMALGAIPIISQSYLTYPVFGYIPRGPSVANHTPVRDWKNLYRSVSRTARDGDQFLFMSPDDQHGLRYARYYFAKFLPWAEEEIHFGHRFGVPTEESIKRLAGRYPEANFWFVGDLNFGSDRQGKLLAAAGAEEERFWQRNQHIGLTLFYMGAPTTNYVANGSFESSVPEQQLPDGVRRDTNTAYVGAASLEVRYLASEIGKKEHWYRYASLPVRPASYRFRNSGFDAWREGLPVGWDLQTGAKELVSAVCPGFRDGTSINLKQGYVKTVISQSISMGLAPGHTVEIEMAGKSDTANNLHLVVRYRGPGYQNEQHVVHPGSGQWETMNMSVDIPADADPDSITAEVWRLPDGGSDVLVDDVEIRVRDIGGRLEPGQPYVLSLALRSENLRDREGSDQRPAGRIRLRWIDSQGAAGHKDLIEIHQEEDWRHRAAPFTPGVDIPLDIDDLYVEAGFQNGTGTIWIDQVQLEKGTQPTPFTDSFRLPHDEALAGAELAQYEVDPAWKLEVP